MLTEGETVLPLSSNAGMTLSLGVVWVTTNRFFLGDLYI